MRPAGAARRARWFAALALAALGGCIVVPVPERKGTFAGQRGNIGDAVPTFIVEGRTTREEVLLNLGEPDRRAEQDRWFAYDSARRLGGVRWLVLVGGGYASAPGFVLGTQQTIDWRELILRFDAAGVVSKAEAIVAQGRGFDFGDSMPVPPGITRKLRPSPTLQAYRDAMRTFVPSEPGERVREGLVAAACQVQGAWHEAVVFVTDRAVYCWTPAPSGGAGDTTLLRWTADAIVAADWAPTESASGRPVVQLQHQDGGSARFAFKPIEGPAAEFDPARAALFLESVRLLRDPGRSGPHS